MKPGIRLAMGLGAIAALAAFGPAGPAGAVESQAQPAQPQALANAYRGMVVCEKMPAAADILHVPFDLSVRGQEVQFARPLFNLTGARVVGSELGAGSVDASGNVHVTSVWGVRGITVRGDYAGSLTASGGTLTGTQSWRGADGAAHSRTCQVALGRADVQQHAAAEAPRSAE